MLIKSKPSTARCDAELYTSYLLSDPRYTSCTRLAEIMGSISHDSVNRFLERERFEAKDLFDEESDRIELAGGILSVDDSVLDKPYMDSKKASFIDYFWSGKHKRTVKGLNLITLFYTDINGVSVPVDYRIYDKTIAKTKNDYQGSRIKKCTTIEKRRLLVKPEFRVSEEAELSGPFEQVEGRRRAGVTRNSTTHQLAS